MSWSRDDMAARAAAEITAGMTVNLGIGIPTLVANHLQRLGLADQVMLHSENGLLGMGPFPYEEDVDPLVINAGKQTVTIVDGGSTFDSTLSFAMIRGGHVDLAILGAMEIAANGDLANWMIPGGLVTGMGGAMDLVSGARRVIVVSRYRTKKGKPKLVQRCSLPLTGLGCVDRIITDVGVFEPQGDTFALIELAPGVTQEDLGIDVPLAEAAR